MTTKDKIVRRKLSLLELAQELSNVSRACNVMGYSRQQFYEIRRNFQKTSSRLESLKNLAAPDPRSFHQIFPVKIVFLASLC